MSIILSESELRLIEKAFDNNQTLLNSLTRVSVLNLIKKINRTKVLSSTEEVNLIITLLLCSQATHSVDEEEMIISDEKATITRQEKNNHNDINMLMQQLLLFVHKNNHTVDMNNVPKKNRRR